MLSYQVSRQYRSNFGFKRAKLFALQVATDTGQANGEGLPTYLLILEQSN
jgi:hypothetical protein